MLNRVDATPFTSSTAGGPSGWRWRRTGAHTGFLRGDGSSNTGQGYSFGTEFNSGEAALGNLTSNANLNASFGVIRRNQTGADLPSVTISYAGEQWRFGGRTDGSADPLRFGYVLGSNELPGVGTTTLVEGLNFNSVVTTGTSGSLVGNDAAIRAILSQTITFGGVGWQAGTDLAVQWLDTDVAGLDDGLGIDDFRVTVVPVPEPACVLALAGGALAASGLRRRLRTSPRRD